MVKEFNEANKYNLYRSVKDILHPSISKKNVSNYNIIISEDILPIQVFYPKKITDIKKIIIFVHGHSKVTDCVEKYADICKLISTKTGNILIAVEYEDIKDDYKKMYQDVFNTVKYLYENLERNNIDPKNITLMGDSTGANIITGINYLNESINIEKEILFYPVLDPDYFGKTKYESMIKNNEFNLGLISNLKTYYEYIGVKDNLDDLLINPLQVDKDIPKTLIITGRVDSLLDESLEYSKKHKNVKIVEVEFSSHGFLKSIDEDIEKEVFNNISKFL